MSEEKPTFKVTDRRLFNADGSPRDIAREEETTAAPAAETIGESSTSSTAAARASTPGRDASAGETATGRTGADTSSTAHAAPRAVDDAPLDDSAGEDMDGVIDQNDFVNLVMFIASPAAAALGMTDHPGLTGRDIDLPLAKHIIDLLGTLQQKTQGNLTAQEEQIFVGLLTELRMQYVSLSTARPAPGAPRFTGGDITGGR